MLSQSEKSISSAGPIKNEYFALVQSKIKKKCTLLTNQHSVIFPSMLQIKKTKTFSLVMSGGPSLMSECSDKSVGDVDVNVEGGGCKDSDI